MGIGKEKEKLWNKLSACGKARYMFENITVEPVAFLYIFSSAFKRIVTQNLNLEKACRVNLSYSEDVCSALKARQTVNLSNEESEVQKLVAGMGAWGAVIESLFPAVIIIFAGSWSDRTRKRKPFMLLPMLGETLSIVGLLICVFYFLELPLEVAIFVESFFPSVFGGWMTFFMSVFSYMGDITTVEMRTVRVGFLNMFYFVGFPLGRGLSGIALSTLGFYGVYFVSMTINVCAFLYCFVKVRDQPSVANEAISNRKTRTTDNGKVVKTPNLYCDSVVEKRMAFDFLRRFFNMKRIRGTFLVVFRNEGIKNQKMRVALLILVHAVSYGVQHAEYSIEYLFMRYRFNWNEVDYSMYTTYYAFLHIIGNSFCVVVFSHIMKFDDALLGVISYSSRILACVVMAFAENKWQVYLVPVVSMLDASNIATRSLASKLVPKKELGKLYSVYDFFAALAPLVYGPLFAMIYKNTISTYPGTFLLVSASLISPSVGIFGWLYLQNVGDAVMKIKSSSGSLVDFEIPDVSDDDSSEEGQAEGKNTMNLEKAKLLP